MIVFQAPSPVSTTNAEPRGFNEPPQTGFSGWIL